MRLRPGHLPLLFLTLLCTCVRAQNIGSDVARVMDAAPRARALAPGQPNPALDTIVMTLAYYAGMPDVDAVERLFSGPALLAHYAGNPAVRQYLLSEQLDGLLERYEPPTKLRLPRALATDQRAAFLQRLAGSELFSRNDTIDLGKIHDVFSAPPAAQPTLSGAAARANDDPLGLSTANLIGNALIGLSDWISRRAQEELTYTFLTKLREDIRRNDLDYLFPNTAEFLPALDLLNYKAILPSIRKAFVEDLRAIAFNFGEYLDQRHPNTFREPEVYNVFLVYRILDLEMREVPLADILAFTYGELERNRIEVRRQIDLRMVRVDTTNPDFRAVLNTFDNLIVATDTLNRRFDRAKDQLSARQLNPLLDAFEDAALEGKDYDLFLDQVDLAFRPVDEAPLPLKNNYREGGAEPPATGIVRAWLRGREAYPYYEAYPSLTRYDELFGPDASRLSPDELRAAGLTAVREVLAHRYALDGYEKQLTALLDARTTLEGLRQELSQRKDAAARAGQTVAEQKAELDAALAAELARSDAPALRMLRRLTAEILPGDPAARARLAAVRDRLTVWVTERGDSGSPFAAKLREAPRQAASLLPLRLAVDDTRTAYDDLQQAVTTYSASRADSLVRSYHNLTTFETVFGLAQQVFFLLADADGDQLFAPNQALAGFQTDAAARRLFAGIGRERLGRVPDLGKFSTPGVADFLLDFGLYLADYQASIFAPDLRDRDLRTRRRIQAVSFVTQTLSALLRAPLLQGDGAGATLSLAERFPAFADVPAVGEELNELFRLSQTGEYRYAVDNLLNLLQLFEVAPTASRKAERLTARRDKLLQLLEDHVVETDADLRAVGLALPTADDLPLLGDNARDEALLERYERELNTPGLDQYARAEARNSIRDLKVSRLQQELARVQERIRKIDPDRTDRFREKLFRYGTFMADVAAANDPTDFESAIAAVALPVGSSQIKRNRPSSVELAAYFGAAASRERLVLPPGITVPELEEDAFGAALFVPVGVSYSRNIGGQKSVTLFGSLLDLGALTAFRLGDVGDDADPRGVTVERLPSFRPANVIAPGLHLMYNFPKSPFTLGFGVQDGPSVRKFTTAGSNQQRNARSVRAMLTFSVDVPIFRFFNR